MRDEHIIRYCSSLYEGGLVPRDDGLEHWLEPTGEYFCDDLVVGFGINLTWVSL